MEYKIESITFKNFKFFYGCEENEESNKLILGRKNLLLYGENGSGKSSVYWALYTILQSSIKSEDNDVIKYFDSSNPENLRNRFASDSEASGLSICFSDEGKRQNIREISDSNVNTINDVFTIKTLLSSDFINYKYLSKIYDFRNSETIDLFPLFERDLFQYIDLEEEYKDENEMLLDGKTFASDWWQNIINTPDKLPHNTNIVSVSSNQYKRFKNTIIPRFCELLKRYLNTITEKANEYLEKEFNCPFRLKFDFNKLVCDYNRSISMRAKDGKLYSPQILLEIRYIHELLDEIKSKVEKPHTFLNEAKLTAIGLSIRLAMLDVKLKNSGGGKILVLDDLLVSLDMSNRDAVLDIILKKASDFQLLILTHDRAFYNIAKLRIGNMNTAEAWVFKEMYHKQHCCTDIPVPVIVNPSSYLSCAEKHLNSFDYPACANYLRKECERVLCKLLPVNLTKSLPNDGESKLLPLERLINNFKTLCGSMSVDFKPYEKLIEHKNLLLNPLSHDNITSPIYKQELLLIFPIIERLNKLNKVIIADVDKQEYVIIKLTNDIGQWEYMLEAREMFFIIKDKTNNKVYLNNPQFLFRWCQNSSMGEIINEKHDLKKGLERIKHRLSISEEIDILNFIYNTKGELLNNIINL